MSKSASPPTLPTPALSYARLAGTVIEYYRTLRGMTQRDIGDALNISQSAYSKIEQGRSSASLFQLRAIAAQCHITLTELVGCIEQCDAQIRARGVIISEDPSPSQAATLIALGILSSCLSSTVLENPSIQDRLPDPPQRAHTRFKIAVSDRLAR